MATPPDHIHISEREPDGSWEDCTWDSGLEWYRLVYDARKPATHAEAQLLRRASGEPATGGSNLGDLARGIEVRYGTAIPARISGINALKAALTSGRVAVIQGSMAAFGPTHRLSKYDRNFDGPHAVVLMNYLGKLLWCDPEAPTGAAVPVEVSWSEVTAFVNKFAGQHVVGTIRNPGVIKEQAVANLTSYLPGYTADVKPRSNIRSEPRIASTKLHAVGASPMTGIAIVGTVKGDVDPVNGSDVWYEFFHDGRSEYTAKDNIVNLKAPVSANCDDVTEPLKATIAEQAATIASQKTDLAEAPIKERARIANAEAERIKAI